MPTGKSGLLKKDEKNEILKSDSKFFSLSLSVCDGSFYKDGETYGRNMFYLVYFILMWVDGLEDLVLLYL